MSIYDFQVKSINGKLVELSMYRGKVLLILNTASRCSYSRQLPDLKILCEIHHEQGFKILGFPCNQFNEKEPESNSEIHEYCESNFGVKFPLFEKVDGPSAHPLFQYLMLKENKPLD